MIKYIKWDEESGHGPEYIEVRHTIHHWHTPRGRSDKFMLCYHGLGSGGLAGHARPLTCLPHIPGPQKDTKQAGRAAQGTE